MKERVQAIFLGHGTVSQVARFLMVGCTTMLIDYTIYISTLWITGSSPLSKGAGFAVGTTCAFLANRYFTFKNRDAASGLIWSFCLVYGATLIVNVTINEVLLLCLGRSPLGINVSFIVSTICSAALNFIGLKRVVFKS